MFGITVVWQSYTAGGDVLKLAFDTQVPVRCREAAGCWGLKLACCTRLGSRVLLGWLVLVTRPSISAAGRPAGCVLRQLATGNWRRSPVTPASTPPKLPVWRLPSIQWPSCLHTTPASLWRRCWPGLAQEQAEEWRAAFADAIGRQTARKPRRAPCTRL